MNSKKLFIKKFLEKYPNTQEWYCRNCDYQIEKCDCPDNNEGYRVELEEKKLLLARPKEEITCANCGRESTSLSSFECWKCHEGMDAVKVMSSDILLKELKRRVKLGEIGIVSFVPEDDYHAPAFLTTNSKFLDLNKLLVGNFGGGSGHSLLDFRDREEQKEKGKWGIEVDKLHDMTYTPLSADNCLSIDQTENMKEEQKKQGRKEL